MRVGVITLYPTYSSSPSGRANAHKEEGNEHFRLKRYPKAVEEYTAGLKEPVEADPTLRALLYTNRAAAQFYLGMYETTSSSPYLGAST